MIYKPLNLLGCLFAGTLTIGVIVFIMEKNEIKIGERIRVGEGDEEEKEEEGKDI